MAFAEEGGVRLRAYQVNAARAVVASVLEGRGLALAVMFPRQSGKNELQAQIEAYLLWTLQEQDAEMVKISPTWRPQSLNAMRRLERVLRANPNTRGQWVKESGFLFRLGRARISFFSGAPEANIVGATASTLLEVDEAQDVQIEKFDREVAPMASSTNATRVFWGTAWTGATLLSRELRAARDAERREAAVRGGLAGQRAFTLTADDVAREVPAYGEFVAKEVARLGRDHPIVRTQYFCEELSEQAGMFGADVIALMAGTHAAQDGPTPGRAYALLLDVGGESGYQSSATSRQFEEKDGRRDATALTIVEVDLSTLADALIRRPGYRVMGRRLWVGTAHTQLYGEIRALALHWNARRVVVDATGVGAGLASFLASSLKCRVIPFLFTTASKSQLGYDWIGAVRAGRWKEAAAGSGGRGQDELRELFYRQLRFCRGEAVLGAAQHLRWGVPDGTRDPLNGAWVHDDLVMSAALCSVLDHEDWPLPGQSAPVIVRAPDPLEEMRGF